MTGANPRSAALAAALAALVGLAGCGLKGTLTMPEKSGNVVIRGQATTGGSNPAPATPATPPPPPADPDKQPPPDLPHSNSGSSH
ncbi:MAG TPA: lipoprotein [Steroidobacteraceae bacterium]